MFYLAVVFPPQMFIPVMRSVLLKSNPKHFTFDVDSHRKQFPPLILNTFYFTAVFLPQMFTPLMCSILLKSDPTHTFRLMWTCTENNFRI